MNSATLSHKLSQKKALLIKGVEKAAPKIPESVLGDSTRRWATVLKSVSEVKKQRYPSENA